MNDTELIKAIRELADEHAACQTADPFPSDPEWCALNEDLQRLLRTVTVTPVSLVCPCGDILVVTDRGPRCRQCVLQGI